MTIKTYIFRGRKFTNYEIKLIKDFISKHKNYSRRKLSISVCEMLSWRQTNTRLKDWACREVLLRMDRENFIKLPPPRIKWAKKNIRYSSIYNFKIEQKP